VDEIEDGGFKLDLDFQNRLSALQEVQLLKKGFIYFILPSILMGLAAIFSPTIYAIIPAHESGNCLCLLHDMQSKPDFVFTLEVTNTVTFFGVNFIFLLVNILMLNRILHVHDKLWVQHECNVMIFVWIFFCIFQYFFFLCD